MSGEKKLLIYKPKKRKLILFFVKKIGKQQKERTAYQKPPDLTSSEGFGSSCVVKCSLSRATLG
jgi:hypothetical protein